MNKKSVVLGIFYLAILTLWWNLFQQNDGLSLISKYWAISLTMVFGSFIAGATSEGGGAVAFPVLTLFLDVKPHIARDFSLLIQSVGMSAASLWIWKKRVPVHGTALLIGTLAGAVGMFCGLLFLQNIIPPAYLKMFFVCTWLGFARVVWQNKISTNTKEEAATLRLIPSQKVLLAFFAFIGGLVSSLTGSGLDIFCFSVLTIYCSVDERVATPTSVVLMAGNAVFAVALVLISNWLGWEAITSFHPTSFHFWLCCVPIVIFGAPLGAMFIRNKARKTILILLVFSIVAQFLAALVIVPHTPALYAFDLLVLAIAFLFFTRLKRS